MQNIEIKYRTADADTLRKHLALQESIKFQWRHRQKDIYFNVPEGRVKIRIEDESRPSLIEYYRPDEHKPRISDYTLTTLEDVDETLENLKRNLGIQVIVEKWRELYFYKNVRIHLDEVNNLGWFLEFESVISDHYDRAAAQQNLDEIIDLLEDFLSETLSAGYMDLLLETKKPLQFNLILTHRHLS